MKVSVICHSLCGNTWVLAKQFQNTFAAAGCESVLYRVNDEDVDRWAPLFPAVTEMKDEIAAAPLATAAVLENSDLIVMGCPTYFGNVSGEMKAFMDSTSMFWPQAKLAGKYFAAFTTAGSNEGGGHLCLQSMLHYSQHMGMASVPVPNALVEGINTCAYGIAAVSGPKADSRPNEKTLELVEAYAKRLVTAVKA